MQGAEGRHRRLALLIADWPAVDRKAWERCTAPSAGKLTMRDLRALRQVQQGGDRSATGPLQRSRRRRRPPVPWSEQRQRQHEFCYGLWLRFLSDNHELDNTDEPVARITVEHVHRFITCVSDRCSATTVHTYTQRLFNIARRLGPGLDWGWFGALVNRLAPPPPDGTAKLTLVRDPAHLLALADDLMERGDGLASAPRVRTGRDGAVLYRDGLMLAVLVFAVVRRSSLLALAPEDTLQRHGDEYMIMLGAGDTKAKRPEVIPLPAELTPAIERYERMHRPLLLDGEDHAAFWISKTRGPLCGNGVWAAVCRHTEEAFGVRIGPHFIRKCVATSHTIRHPELIGTLPVLLQHRDIRVTERHYMLARNLLAHERHQSAVAAERKAEWEAAELANNCAER